jgi:ribosome maturation factor RimP
MAVSADAIRALVEPALISSGLELWDVEVSGDSVRVLVDRPGGIDLDALAAVAGKVVSPLLDEHPELTPPGRFSLEVSSPGVERDLRRVEHYARYIGSELSVKTSRAVEGGRRHHGNLLSVTDRSITLAPRDAPAGEVLELPFELIDRARTVLVWGPAEKPGHPKGARGAKGAKASSQAVKRPAADGRQAGQPVASNDAKDTGS